MIRKAHPLPRVGLRRSLLLTLLLILLPASLIARPHTTLVLGGGGARGLAHVGVLQALHELRVPIDSVVGTSMGAIVGGLYAYGYTPEEMEQLVLEIDWNEILQDGPDREDKNLRRKRDRDDHRVKLTAGLGEGELRLPQGLLQGQRVKLWLHGLMLAAPSRFDELPLPFRAVATDLESGAEVILADGSLTDALRASMAAPLAFAPVDWRGRLLVDGAVANNVPVSVAQRAFAAERIIAVSVDNQLKQRDKLGSLVDVGTQVIDLLVRRQTEAELALLKPTDILVRPALGDDISPTDFTSAEEAIALGYAEVMGLATRLRDWRVSEAEFTAQRVAMAAQRPEAAPRVDRIRLENRTSIPDEAITGRVESPVGEPLDPETMREDAKQIYALDAFDRVEMRLERRVNGNELVVEPISRSWGPSFIRLGFELENDFEGQATHNIGLRVRSTDLFGRQLEWLNALRVGQDPRWLSELYRPFGSHGQFFTSASFELSRSSKTVFEEGERLSEYRLSESRAGVAVGRLLGNWGELRLGLSGVHAESDRRIGEAIDQVDLDEGIVTLAFNYDTLDSIDFPRFGATGTLRFDAHRLGGDGEHDRVTLEGLRARSRGAGTWLLAGLASSVVSGRAEINDEVELGGLFSLPGLRRQELSGQHGLVGRVIHYHRLSDPPTSPLDVPLYVGASLELGNVWERREEIDLGDLLFAGSLFLGADTPIGPFFFGIGASEGGANAAYLSLGRSF